MTGFIAKHLSVLAYASGGFTLFHYHHAGPIEEVLAPGFFADEGGAYFVHRSRITITAADTVADVVCDCRGETMAMVVTMRANVPAMVKL